MSDTVQLPIPAKLAPLFTAINKRYCCSHGGRRSAKTRTFALMTAVKSRPLHTVSYLCRHRMQADEVELHGMTLNDTIRVASMD